MQKYDKCSYLAADWTLDTEVVCFEYDEDGKYLMSRIASHRPMTPFGPARAEGTLDEV